MNVCLIHVYDMIGQKCAVMAMTRTGIRPSLLTIFRLITFLLLVCGWAGGMEVVDNFDAPIAAFAAKLNFSLFMCVKMLILMYIQILLIL